MKQIVETTKTNERCLINSSIWNCSNDECMGFPKQTEMAALKMSYAFERLG